MLQAPWTQQDHASAIELLKSEADLFWRKFNFMSVVQVAVFVAYAQVKGDPFGQLVIAASGFVLSCGWSLLTRAGSDWHRNLLRLLINSQPYGEFWKELQKHEHDDWLGRSNYSSFRIAVWVTKTLIAVWAMLLASQIPKYLGLTWPCEAYLPRLIALAVVGLFVLGSLVSLYACCKKRQI